MLKNIFKSILPALPHVKQCTAYRHYASLPNRFYKNTSVIHSGNGNYEILLDNRKLKTAQGTPLIVESEPLANAVAVEWDSQRKKIDRSSMHLTALCNTAIDNPNKFTKEDIVNYILNFLPTDTILFYTKEEEDLYKMQCIEWDPILNWFNQKFETEIEKSCDINPPILKSGTQMIITKHLLSYNLNALHAFVYAVDVLKSPILAFACVDRYLTVEQAVRLARLEEEYQIKQWGRVEWSHDLSEHDSRARLAAAILFVHMNSTQHFVKEKLNV